jgi:2-keto-4-pentenoate hydratase/2-oxohepta-3-ene-1,7-dioic acid hydratase in catechol pathway
MKLMRVGAAGHEVPALLDADGHMRSLAGVTADFGGAGVALAALDSLRGIDPATLPVITGRVGCPLSHVPNFLCVGLNYARHAAEAGMPVPAEPILFNKTASALSGPFDPVILPPGHSKVDWEVELGIVIGRETYQVSEADALACVAGYVTVNDVSERAWQIERGGQWTKGKSAPTFGPVGPWLVTADAVPDPQALGIMLALNGVTVQDSSTSDMIFGVAHIISYMSRFMRLLPGDLIATGTPEGVGMGAKPQRFLRAGDVMDLEVTGLGRQRLDVI